MTKPPYERIVQWAGPVISLGIGYLAFLATQGSLGSGAQQVTHASHMIAGHLQATTTVATSGPDQTAKAILGAVSFLVGTGVPAALHLKWLSNLPQWWESSGLTAPATSETVPDAPDTSPPFTTDDFAPGPSDVTKASASFGAEAPGSPDFADAITAHQQSMSASEVKDSPEAATEAQGTVDPARALRAQLSAAGMTPSA